MKNIKQRIEYISKNNDNAENDKTIPTYTIRNWRGKKTLNLKILNLEIKYLMYRIDNSRTEIQQLAYIRNNPHLPKNLFSDSESQKAQDAQEKILNQINKASGKDFFEDLKKKGQEEPAIITYDGYLVNGNRRTAALKSIGVEYLDCVVLPKITTPRDIYEIEQQLQISQDFRVPYHWINELRNIKKGLEDKRYGIDEVSMADRLRIGIKELRAKRIMLDLIDSFLIWKNIPGQYDYPKLEETEQVFIQLEKAVRRFKDIKKLSELKYGVFMLIEEKPTKERVYKYVSAFIRNFDEIFDKMIRSNPQKNKQIKKSTDKNILDSLLKNEPVIPSVFNDASKAKKLAPILLDKIIEVDALNKEKTDKEFVYNSVSEALRTLQGLRIEKQTSELSSIKNKLEQLVTVSNDLLKQIKKIK